MSNEETQTAATESAEPTELAEASTVAQASKPKTKPLLDVSGDSKEIRLKQLRKRAADLAEPVARQASPAEKPKAKKTKKRQPTAVRTKSRGKKKASVHAGARKAAAKQEKKAVGKKKSLKRLNREDSTKRKSLLLTWFKKSPSMTAAEAQAMLQKEFGTGMSIAGLYAIKNQATGGKKNKRGPKPGKKAKRKSPQARSYTVQFDGRVADPGWTPDALAAKNKQTNGHPKFVIGGTDIGALAEQIPAGMSLTLSQGHVHIGQKSQD